VDLGSVTSLAASAVTGDITKAARRSRWASAPASARSAPASARPDLASEIESVARQPEMRNELQSIRWLGFASARPSPSTRSSSSDRFLPLGGSASHIRARRREQGRRQLPGLARARADDLDADRVRCFDADPAAICVPAYRRGTREAFAADPGFDRPRRADAQESDALLEEYRARLKEAREQAEDILVRSRKAAEQYEAETRAQAQKDHQEALERTRREIEARLAARSTRSARRSRTSRSSPPRRSPGSRSTATTRSA